MKENKIQTPVPGEEICIYPYVICMAVAAIPDVPLAMVSTAVIHFASTEKHEVDERPSKLFGILASRSPVALSDCCGWMLLDDLCWKQPLAIPREMYGSSKAGGRLSFGPLRSDDILDVWPGDLRAFGTLGAFAAFARFCFFGRGGEVPFRCPRSNLSSRLPQRA